MLTERFFKVAFLIAFFLLMAGAIRTARRAKNRHGGSLNQLTSEVPGLVAVRGALGLIFYLALAGWLWDLRWMNWSRYALPIGVRAAAALLLLVVLVVFAASYEALGTNYRGGVGLYDAHELVTAGPYRIVRHPIYAGFIATMILVAVVSANWLLGASGVLLVSSIAAARIPVEERELRDRFGSDWDRYRARTGSLIPRIGP